MQETRDIRNSHTISVEKPKGKKKPLCRPGRKGQKNIKINRKEIWYECVIWIYMVLDGIKRLALVNTISLWVP
jgi:hypothetical protein